MASPAHHPETAAERLISATIQSTWILWLVGGLYIAGPVLGWTLAAIAARDQYIAPALPSDRRPRPIPWPVWLWIFGMLAMEIVLLAGHLNFDLGLAKTIKSSVGWAKGWALLALFILVGAVLRIRPEVIYRAICKLGLQTLVLLPVFVAAPFIGLPSELWVSPLKVLGGSGPEYFATTLYTIEPGAGTPRWQFFAPWSPAAGMVAVIYFLLAMQEKSPGWRAVGMVAGLSIAVLSQSRLALVALAFIVPFVIMVGRVRKPSTWGLAAAAALVLAFLGQPLMEFADQLLSDVKGARADSTRVREALGRIAVERWQGEAFWTGHGIVENGPHLVEYMPIGSHHSWYGLLFVKGLLGAIALAIPLGASFAVLLWRAPEGRLLRAGLAMVTVQLLYSFGENLEVLGYLTWPGLVLLGIALAAPARPSDAKDPLIAHPEPAHG